MTDAKQLKDKLAKKFRTANLEFKAVLGRSDGQVISLETDASPEDVYVTLYNGSVISLHNDRVPRVPFRKVVVGYDDRNSELFQVLRFDNLYTTRPHPNVANHKDSHTWFGYDPVDVYKEQVMPLLPRATSGLNIIIYGGGYMCNGLYHIMPTKTLDLTAEAVSSGAEWVNVEIDASGTITYQHGSNVASRALLTPETIPATSTAKKLLCSVMMYAGQSEIIQTRIDTDIFDPRLTGQDSTAPMLSDLSDVLIDSYLADGDVLVWDNYLGLFVNQPQTGGGVETVTGDGVDNTNPANPVISYPTPGDIGAESASNKATTMSGNTTSNIVYLTAKAVYDWAVGLFSQLGHVHAAGDVTSGTMATARLGSGTADSTTFLRGDQTWATPAGGGDWELISDSVLGSSAANFDLTSIPGTYKHLHIDYSLRSDRAFGSDRVKIVINNDTSSSKYESILYYWFHSGTWGTIDPGSTSAAIVTFVTAATGLANSFGGGFIDFVNYANTTTLKLFQVRGGQMQSTSIKPEIYDGMAVWRDTSAITRITISPTYGSNWVTGSRITLYGMK